MVALRLALMAIFGGLAVAGCTSTGTSEPEAAAAVASVDQSPERAAAVAEMRAKAEAGELAPFPDAYGSTHDPMDLPKPVSEVDAAQAKLTRVGAQRSASISTSEAAAVEQRALLLRQLAEERKRQVQEAIASD